MAHARLRAARNRGRCSECGMYDPASAPDSCVRDAFARARAEPAAQATEAGEITSNRLRFDDFWVELAERYRRGGVPGDRFLVFTSHGDDEPLEPAQHLAAHYVTATGAERAARTQLARYPQVWIVTKAGAWRITSSDAGQTDVGQV